MMNEEEKDVSVRQFWRKWRKMESNLQVLGAAENSLYLMFRSL